MGIVKKAEMDFKEIVAFNLQQVEHIRIHQEMVFQWASGLIQGTFGHDRSKFNEDQYWTFVEGRTTLHSSPDGKDEGFKKYLHTDAIQRHITQERHHPEHWDLQGEDSMPIACAIQMYFDWKARCTQNGRSMEAFWESNVARLTKQPTARVVVEQLKLEDEIGLLLQKVQALIDKEKNDIRDPKIP